MSWSHENHNHASQKLYTGAALIPVILKSMQSATAPFIVELKGGRSYRGVLDGYDPHMNLVLRNAEELHNSEIKRKLEMTIVRGDNVIYISP